MIVRIVRMEFRPDAVTAFEALFESRKDRIRAQEGCSRLELWQDAHHPQVFFTYSIWEAEDFLDRYRFSAFFKETWSATRALFAARAQAWSVSQRAVLP